MKRKIIYVLFAITILGLYLLKAMNNTRGYFDIWIQGALLLGALIMVGILYFKKQTNHKWKIAIFLLLIALFVSYPLYNDYLVYSHDINFNLVRIEGLKEALENGQIPARIHPIENNGYGYATSLLYPELFLYIPAILRLLNTSMVFTFKLFLIFINIVAVGSMYIAVKKISKSTASGIIGAIVFAAANYRLENVFTRASIGEALALAFCPIAIWGLYELLLGEKKKWYLFVIGFTFVLQSHKLSVMLLAISCAIIGIYFIKNIIKQKRYKEILLAIVTTLLINLWFMVPFLDAYQLDLKVKNTDKTTKFYTFENYTVIPAQLFNLFDTANSLQVAENNEQGMEDEMAYTLGIMCSIGLVISIGYWIKNRKKKDMQTRWLRILTILALVFVILSTTILPWKELQEHVGIIKWLCATMQFGWRFLGMATVLITICMSIIMGKYVEEKKQQEKDCVEKYKIIIAIGLIAFLAVPMFLAEYSKQFKYITNESPLNYDLSAQNEYFIQGTDTTKLIENQFLTSSNKIVINHTTKKGSKITIDYYNQEGEGYIEVPLLYYPGYIAKDEKGNKLEVVCGANNVVRVKLTKEDKRNDYSELSGKSNLPCSRLYICNHANRISGIY